MKQPLHRELKFCVSRTAEQMGREAANLVIAGLKRRPDLLLCASAGGTPTGLYQSLAAHYHANPGLFAKLRVLLIDEWLGLPAGHPATCKEDVSAKLLRPLRISASRLVAFRSAAADPAAECLRISRWLASHGPIDICILGLGANGHIGMNEPADVFTPQAHVAKLAPASLRHPLLKDIPRKPSLGLSLGLREILASTQIFLLVSGPHKRRPLARLRELRAATPRFPASALWLHSRSTVFCDRAAAGLP